MRNREKKRYPDQEQDHDDRGGQDEFDDVLNAQDHADRIKLSALLQYDGTGAAGRLWDKEVSFIEGLEEWDGPFTPRQRSWLLNIHKRIFGESR